MWRGLAAFPSMAGRRGGGLLWYEVYFWYEFLSTIGKYDIFIRRKSLDANDIGQQDVDVGTHPNRTY